MKDSRFQWYSKWN